MQYRNIIGVTLKILFCHILHAEMSTGQVDRGSGPVGSGRARSDQDFCKLWRVGSARKV